MIRNFLLSSDNIPQSTNVSTTATAGSGYISVETANPVSWAVIANANVSLTSNTPMRGPYFFDPVDAQAVYNVETISGVPGITYIAGSLSVYYNGQLLTKDVEYTETTTQTFTFQVGASALPELPSLTDGDKLMISFRISAATGSLSTSESVYISDVYPDVSTGFRIRYEGFSVSDPINLSIIYK